MGVKSNKIQNATVGQEKVCIGAWQEIVFNCYGHEIVCNWWARNRFQLFRQDIV